MRIKTILTIFLALIFLIAIYTSPLTRDIAKKLLEFSTSFFAKLKIPFFERLEQFPVRIEVRPQDLHGNNFKISGNFRIKGECFGNFTMGGLIMEFHNESCVVEGYAKDGNLIYDKITEVNCKIDKVRINGRNYIANSLNFKFKPLEIYFEKAAAESLKGEKSYGSISKLKNGKLDLTKYLNGEDFEVKGFSGKFELAKTLKLEGNCLKIIFEKFEWKHEKV